MRALEMRPLSAATRAEPLAAYLFLAGLGDLATGCALVAAPALVLQLLWLPSRPDLVLLRFVGVFVAQVGLATLYPTWRGLATATSVLELTTLARLGVGVFLLTAVAARALPSPWLLVAFWDLALAGVQIAWLRRGVENGGNPER